MSGISGHATERRDHSVRYPTASRYHVYQYQSFRLVGFNESHCKRLSLFYSCSLVLEVVIAVRNCGIRTVLIGIKSSRGSGIRSPMKKDPHGSSFQPSLTFCTCHSTITPLTMSISSLTVIGTDNGYRYATFDENNDIDPGSSTQSLPVPAADVSGHFPGSDELKKPSVRVLAPDLLRGLLTLFHGHGSLLNLPAYMATWYQPRWGE